MLVLVVKVVAEVVLSAYEGLLILCRTSAARFVISRVAPYAPLFHVTPVPYPLFWVVYDCVG